MHQLLIPGRGGYGFQELVSQYGKLSGRLRLQLVVAQRLSVQYIWQLLAGVLYTGPQDYLRWAQGMHGTLHQSN